MVKKLAAVLASVMLATAMLGSGSTAHTTTVTTSSGFTTTRQWLVDPSTGLVFLSGDDAVKVFHPDGTLDTTILDIYGASGMDIVDGSLWVAESTAGKIAKIDIASLTVTTVYTVGQPVGDNLAVIGSAVFFGIPSGCCGSSSPIGRFDTTTGTATTFGGISSPTVLRIPGDPAHLLAYSRGSGGGVYKVNTTAPYATASWMTTSSSLARLAISADGSTFWSASGSPYIFTEWSLTTMAATGVVYPGTAYPRGIAYSAAFGGIIAGSAGGKLWISAVGQPVTVAQITAADTPLLALAPDGSAVYHVDDGQLVTDTLAAAITGASPSTVVADVPTSIQLTGTGLGGTASATIGGVDAPVVSVSPTSVTVTMPDGVAPGTRTIALAGPLGITTTTITVQANVGATLSGTVRAGSTAAPGVELTLSGGPLVTPRSTTSDVTGQYAFDALPYGTTYTLVVHDPATATEQTISAVTIVPNKTHTFDIDLTVPVAPTDWRLATVQLPAGAAKDLLVEPTTGRVFVANGNEVDVLDSDGHLIGRVQNVWGATSLTAGDGMVFVGSASAARVTRIDPTTLAVTGSWPLNTLTNGAIGFAGGRIYFTYGNDQWTSIWSLDPADGTTMSAGTGSLYVPRMRTVEDDPNRLLVWEVGISSKSGYVYTAATGKLTLQKSASGIGGPSIASATSNKVWNPSGREFSLSTLAATGATYPGTGPVAHAPGHGGVVAFGSTIVREGIPVATHALNDTPVQVGLDSSGGRAFAVDASNTFVVYDLAPHVTGVIPAPLYPDVATITLAGSGLRATTTVTVDGAARTFTSSGPNQLDVDITDLPVGPHTVVVTTPWGSTDPVPFSSEARPPAPTVTGLDQASIPTTGGTVTITGTGFSTASAVHFGTVPATDFTVVDDSHVTAVVPAHADATVTVHVTNDGGTNVTSPAFSWVSPPPVVTALSVTVGPTNVGTPVTITGSGFRYATAVAFGDTATTFTVVNDTRITTIAPAHVSGPVDVRVTNATGTSPAGPGSIFTYVEKRPTIASVSPSSGPTSGGNLVTIEGARLTGASAVHFGTSEATDKVVIDDGTLVVVAPAHVQGTVDVTVTTAAGTSVLTEGGQYLYLGPDMAPSAPTDVTGSWAGSGAISIAWSPPATDNGSAVTHYIVTASPGGAACTWVAGPHTCIVSGLTNGTAYSFAVTATNAEGAGPAAVTEPLIPTAFSDVPFGAPFYGDIDWLVAQQIATGHLDGTFRPTDATSRGAMAAFLYRFAGSPDGVDPSCTSAPFSDVSIDNEFCGEITWLIEQGITTGFLDGTFHPQAQVSRQAMAAFLYRFEGSPDGADPSCTSAPFSDVSIDNEFCGEITWLAASGITSGFTDGGFHPTAAVLRQAMAAFLHKM